MFFCPIHNQLKTLLDHNKLSKEEAVENTHSNCGAHTPPRWCALIFIKQTKQTCSHLSIQSRQLIKPSQISLLWEPCYLRQRSYEVLLDVFHPSRKPSLLMICFMSLSLSLRGLQFRCQLDSRLNVLISCSTFRRRWCCIHNRPVSRIWIFSNPSLVAMPFDALLYSDS